MVDAVHAKGSYIFLQLWAQGRTADPKALAAEPTGPYNVVSASNIPLANEGNISIKEAPMPRELTVEEIKEYVGWYAQAAKNFVELAGGDGVESESSRSPPPCDGRHRD